MDLNTLYFLLSTIPESKLIYLLNIDSSFLTTIRKIQEENLKQETSHNELGRNNCLLQIQKRKDESYYMICGAFEANHFGLVRALSEQGKDELGYGFMIACRLNNFEMAKWAIKRIKSLYKGWDLICLLNEGFTGACDGKHKNKEMMSWLIQEGATGCDWCEYLLAKEHDLGDGVFARSKK